MIVERERSRLGDEWRRAATDLRAIVAAAIAEYPIGKTIKGHGPRRVNRDQARQTVADVRFVNPEAYQNAAREGVLGVRGNAADHDFDDVAQRVRERVASFAGPAAIRIADNFADHVDEWLAQDLPSDLSALWASVDAKIAALGSDVTRYAEPPWNAGYVGYGETLAHFDVLMNWVAEDDENTCDDCLVLEADSPYAVGDIPTWPAQGDTICLDHCRCTIEAESDSWDAAFGDKGE